MYDDELDNKVVPMLAEMHERWMLNGKDEDGNPLTNRENYWLLKHTFASYRVNDVMQAFRESRAARETKGSKDCWKPAIQDVLHRVQEIHGSRARQARWGASEENTLRDMRFKHRIKHDYELPEQECFDRMGIYPTEEERVEAQAALAKLGGVKSDDALRMLDVYRAQRAAGLEMAERRRQERERMEALSNEQPNGSHAPDA